MAGEAPSTAPRVALTGQINYSSDAALDAGRVHGHERFTVTRLPDGRMIQRAHCRITDPPDVERDSLLAVDGELRPTDAMVRIETDGQFSGTAWYRFEPRQVECEAFTAADGRTTYRRSLQPGPIPFCSHALVGDAWMIAAAAPARDGQRQPCLLLTSTLNKRGASGPTLAVIPYGVERIGATTITVPAGTFPVVHYRCGRVDSPDQLATANFDYNIWISADEFRLAILSTYPGRARYQLISLQRL